MQKNSENNINSQSLKDIQFKHGGNLLSKAKQLNLLPSEIIDSSASLVPFDPPKILLDALNSEIKTQRFRYYPESNLNHLKDIIGEFHQINPERILPGNGASELITWAGYEASKFGKSSLPSPGFVDYERYLKCWDGNFSYSKLPQQWNNSFPQSFPLKPICDVIWITNPHNPTGQLWDKDSLEDMLKQYKLVICDEAFLAMTPEGEKQSLIPFTKKYDNLLVIRSLTKLFNIAGLRLGYVIGAPNKIIKWNLKRDPWPLNSFAIKAGITLLRDRMFYEEWTKKIHDWIITEKTLVINELSKIQHLKVHYSSTNFFLIESKYSLSSNIEYLENKGILIRECTSFKFLNERWARISLQSKKNNEILCRELQNSFKK